MRIGSVISRLKEQHAITERPQPISFYTQREFTPLTEPDIEQFTKEEIDVLLRAALEIAPLTAKRASDNSHDDLWKATTPDGRMSVAAGSVKIMPPTPEIMERAREVFASRG
jgi:hypothetical protein